MTNFKTTSPAPSLWTCIPFPFHVDVRCAFDSQFFSIFSSSFHVRNKPWNTPERMIMMMPMMIIYLPHCKKSKDDRLNRTPPLTFTLNFQNVLKHLDNYFSIFVLHFSFSCPKLTGLLLADCL